MFTPSQEGRPHHHSRSARSSVIDSASLAMLLPANGAAGVPRRAELTPPPVSARASSAMTLANGMTPCQGAPTVTRGARSALASAAADGAVGSGSDM